MTVFVIKVTPEASVSKVSQQGYKTIEEARAFIKSRGNGVYMNSPYVYRDADYTEYEIVEVTI